MKDFVEQFLRIFFRRFIVRNIGYYVLRILFALFNNQKGITWLLSTNSNEGESLAKGLIVNIVGLMVLAFITFLVVYIVFLER